MCVAKYKKKAHQILAQSKPNLFEKPHTTASIRRCTYDDDHHQVEKMSKFGLVKSRRTKKEDFKKFINKYKSVQLNKIGKDETGN